MIEASFLSQYGIRLRFTEMLWDEFTVLLSNLMSDTPLGKVVAIRSENDPEMLKNFTPELHKIRNEWKSKQAKQMSKEDYDSSMQQLSNIFKGLAK